MKYNVVLITDVQPSDSVIHIYIYICIIFYILFHYSLSQDIKYSSLCSRVGPTLLLMHSIYTRLDLLISESHSCPLPPPHPLGNHHSILCVPDFLFHKEFNLCHILDSTSK